MSDPFEGIYERGMQSERQGLKVVTPAMRDAGQTVLAAAKDLPPGELVEAIYAAMLHAATPR